MDKVTYSPSISRNRYINWPFVPEIVDFMENFTSQAHALQMQVKFYYTIRELTNHAVELFALKALQGEVILDEDPYTIPQAGYCHSWDCHGGSAWLHQHVMNNYVYCWQQGLSNGEIDGSVCDIGTSRWFNYYLEGLRRSVESPPHMDGIYCKRPANHDAPFHDSPMILCASVL